MISVAIAHQLAHVARATTAGTPMLRATMAVWDGAAPEVGDEGGEAAAAQAQHVGGRNIVRHDDQGFVAVHMTHVRQHGGCAGQHAARVHDLAHVGAALAQVLVFHGVELLAQDLALRGQRAHSAL